MGEKYYEELKKLITGAAGRMLDLEEEDFEFKASPEKWSKKEILGHLIDSALNNHQRFIRAWDNDDLIFDGYDQVEWVKRSGYQQREKEELIHLFISVNLHLALVVKDKDDAELTKTTNRHNFDQIGMRPVEKGSETSLGFLIEDYKFHLIHHLKQILDIRC